VDVDFYKKILDKETYQLLKSKEDSDSLRKGDLFKTKEDTVLVYIGNNHKWFQVPKKLFNLFKKLEGKEVMIVGGADSECLSDVYTAAESMGVKIKRDWKFIYTASHCPI
jgi:hypothetical protein